MNDELPPSAPRPSLSPRQTARVLGYSVSGLYLKWSQGQGPDYYEDGCRRRCTPEAIERYRRELEAKTVAKRQLEAEAAEMHGRAA
jgi:hypothetical protein